MVGNVGDGLIRCERKRRVASEVFKLLLVSLDELSGCFSDVVM